MGVGRYDWIDLVQDRSWWWTPVNTVMNLHIPQKGKEFLD
jgi:hypothetical protein